MYVLLYKYRDFGNFCACFWWNQPWNKKAACRSTCSTLPFDGDARRRPRKPRLVPLWLLFHPLLFHFVPPKKQKPEEQQLSGHLFYFVVSRSSASRSSYSFFRSENRSSYSFFISATLWSEKAFTSAILSS